MNLNIFVTGGLGFIGSHTVLVLLNHGCTVTLIDNLSNSFPKVFDHMTRLAGDKASQMKYIQCDIRDEEGLEKIFSAEKFDSVIHFAGFKAVGESVAKPLEYYDNNFAGTITLLKVMKRHGCKNMVFSSSCTVYGLPDKVPLSEDAPVKAISPYGRTKEFQEHMFRDIAAGDPEWRVLLLRYFNPIGAHPTGELGEHPVGIPNNLMPYIQQVALKQRDYLSVYGGDYPTPDGTCIRDYIHVMDLAEGHVSAVNKILGNEKHGCQAVNLGTGKGTSVLEMIDAFERASGVKVAYKVVDKRPGDSTAVWAATETAERELGWVAQYDVHDMCAHQWAWASKYPAGYEY